MSLTSLKLLFVGRARCAGASGHITADSQVPLSCACIIGLALVALSGG